jgi:hypothetical protein
MHIRQTQGARHKRILIFGLVLLAIMLLTATVTLALMVRWAPAPPATPIPVTPAPTEPVLPSVVNPALLDVRTSVTLTLPTSWQTADLDADAFRQTASRIGNGAAQTLLSAVGDDAVVRVALLDQASTAATPTSLMVIAVQRNELSLDRYLEDVRGGLVAQGAAVHAAAMNIDLRKDGLPVATLHYTLAAEPGAAALDGYQVIAYDTTATQFVLFTFTTPSTRYAEMLPVFQETVRSADF